MAIPDVAMTPLTSVWDVLPKAVASVNPRTFEFYGQNQGLVLYRTTLVGRKSGRLVITDLHDYAQVFVDGALIGTLDRRLGEKSIDLPATTNARPVLDILVEGMGHINFAQEMIDRKGITDRVTLSGMTLTNFSVYLFPLDSGSLGALSSLSSTGSVSAKPAMFFKGDFTLASTADTFIDMTGYRKGVVWVNGHNLGRYWDIGPQTRLYCPASWLKAGANEIMVLDMHMTTAAPVRGHQRP